jgi:hypothetical protein
VAADYRGLRFDPTPGSPDAVTAVSERCTRAARLAEGAVPAVEHVAGGQESWWSGGAAASFGAQLERVPAELARAKDTLRAAAEILDDWAGTLRANQRRADELDRRALELRRALDSADDDVSSAYASLQIAVGSAARTADADHAAALARQAQLQRDLDRVLEAARVLEHDHLTAAQRVAEQLRVLGSDGPDALGQILRTDELFGRLTQTLGTFSSQAGALALTLLGSGGGLPVAVPAVGAASRFASALTAPPGSR